MQICPSGYFCGKGFAEPRACPAGFFCPADVTCFIVCAPGATCEPSALVLPPRRPPAAAPPPPSCHYAFPHKRDVKPLRVGTGEDNDSNNNNNDGVVCPGATHLRRVTCAAFFTMPAQWRCH